MRRASPLLVQLADGRWTGAAAMPRLIATFSLGADGVVSLIYRPVGWQAGGDKTERVIAALRTGALRTEDALDVAAGLRDGKMEDPVLGVLAAYLYDSIGDVDSIRRMAFFYAHFGQAVPFDVAMLARLGAERAPDGTIVAQIPAVRARPPASDAEEQRRGNSVATPARPAPVAGLFPWLRQGWALLEEEDPSPLFLTGLPDLQSGLARAPFTTLDAEHGQRLKSLVFPGDE